MFLAMLLIGTGSTETGEMIKLTAMVPIQDSSSNIGEVLSVVHS